MARILRDILYGVGIEAVHGSTDLSVNDLQVDSRHIEAGDAFIAISGSAMDGHQFISKAISQGANTIICEQLPDQKNDSVTYIVVRNSREAVALMAANYHNHPSTKLKLVGVTGTNGKTTTVTMLYELFNRLGFKVGLLSTIENKIGSKVLPATHTTPDSIVLNALLNDMVEAGCSFVFMEVSSHAIHQHRIDGLSFAGGIFTNISRDHLDYHKKLKDYIAVKKTFFDQLPAGAFALINTDDRRGKIMVQNTKANVRTYALKALADYRMKIVESTFSGLVLEVNNVELYSRMVGRFNAYNILAVFAAAELLEQDNLEILEGISMLNGAEGRFEYLISEKDGVIGIVDYAHTPDALKNVLQTVKEVRTGAEQLITMLGCGGDRDKGKRPMMARIATELSDKVILTSDNPRSESPDAIIDDMKEGIPPHLSAKVLVIVDRKEAIRTACSMAKANDILVVAGKGHEKYQEISGERFSFDDKKVLMDAFKEFNK